MVAPPYRPSNRNVDRTLYNQSVLLDIHPTTLIPIPAHTGVANNPGASANAIAEERQHMTPPHLDNSEVLTI